MFMGQNCKYTLSVNGDIHYIDAIVHIHGIK